MTLVGPRQVSPALLVGAVTSVAVLIVAVVAVLRIVGDGDEGTVTSAIGSEPTLLPADGDGSTPGAAQGGATGADDGPAATLAPGGPSTTDEVTTTEPSASSSSDSSTTAQPTTTESTTTTEPTTTTEESTTTTSEATTTTEPTTTTRPTTTTTEPTTTTTEPTTTTTEPTTTTTATTTTLPDLTVALSRSSCGLAILCRYSMRGTGATPDGVLTLRITNDDGEDIRNDGYEYGSRVVADSRGRFDLDFQTVVRFPDTHTFAVVDDATGRSASDSLRFRLFG